MESSEVRIFSTSVYPNPTTGNVVLILKEPEISREISYSIITTEGVNQAIRNRVSESEVNQSLSEDISKLKNGVYTIQLKNGAYLHFIKVIKI